MINHCQKERAKKKFGLRPMVESVVGWFNVYTTPLLRKEGATPNSSKKAKQKPYLISFQKESFGQLIFLVIPSHPIPLHLHPLPTISEIFSLVISRA